MKWNPEFTPGHALTFATVGVGLVIAYANMTYDVRATQLDVTRLNQRLTQLEDKYAATLEALAADKVVQTEILTEFRADLRYLRQAVDRLQKVVQ